MKSDLRDFNKTKILLENFQEIESKRDEIWKKFTQNKNFESTYEAVEKLTTIYKKKYTTIYIN